VRGSVRDLLAETRKCRGLTSVSRSCWSYSEVLGNGNLLQKTRKCLSDAPVTGKCTGHETGVVMSDVGNVT